MALHPLPKKIKLEDNGATEPSESDGGEDPLGNSIEEQEEALIALIEHRSKEVELLGQKASYYQSQAETAKRKLQESQLQLARLRVPSGPAGSRRSRVESFPPVNGVEARPEPRAQSHSSRPPLIIPSINSKLSTTKAPPPSAVPRNKPAPSSQPTHEAPEKSKRETSTVRSSEKRNLVEKEHQDLIPSVRKSSSPNTIPFHPGTYIHSQHKRKLRTLVLSPVDDQLLVTSALDGVVNLWQKKVTYWEEKPHIKGIINSINFMPWNDICFATGGSDHAVILWSEKIDSWKHKAIHRNLHSSAVMGVAGLLQKRVILSTGSDKRVIGFDLLAERAAFKNQIDSRCMSVLPNPCDFNLFMVQTGTITKQLRLFDIRLRQTEIHSFGWKQESSETQSALINQAWSPDGLYVSSGTVDPMIHIFDIRYNGNSPSQSVQAHQKRVFKAIWHQSHPLMTTISSDLNIGLHKFSK
ncbi:hypothetical protein KFK09_011228 [Dendrobium nobile]|uniref:Uncharacterized protein n=1 Tax=Dendrobium nobile TaxID=94219 RepID=A0A8T3BED0_DENNO|nr:hypothetical protein KFK09_011228 [Dendrobium nobile]